MAPHAESLTFWAARLGGELMVAAPEGALFLGPNTPEGAQAEHFVFRLERRAEAALLASSAGALFSEQPLPAWNKAWVRVPNARVAFAQALALQLPPSPLPSIHPTAFVHPQASLGPDCVLGPFVCVEAGAKVGARCRLDAGVVVGAGAELGPDAHLHPHVVIGHGVRLGKKVVVQAGAILGSEGYGFVRQSQGLPLKLPQVGGLWVGDDVEIGANCTIDRGTLGDTVLGRGCKLDNLVHVGHNVRLGEGVFLVAQVGLSGGVQLGDGVTMAGQAGAAGHLNVGANATVAARAGLTKDVPPGQTVSGFPARPHRQALRVAAALEGLAQAALAKQQGRPELPAVDQEGA